MNTRFTPCRITGLIIIAIATAACTPAERPAVRTADAGLTERRSSSAPVPIKLAPGWRRLDPAAVTGGTAEKLAVARRAAQELGRTLGGTLQSAVGQDRDYVRGTEACRTAAPTIARTVSATHRAQVGRTSFRVRNPDNRPAPWAQPVVDQRVGTPLLMAGPEGAVAFMAPIQLKPVCTVCHGQRALIPAEVRAALAEVYPEDEAVGFQPGDLRGWFWVKFDAEPERVP